jgi:cation transport ATPase
MSRDNFIKMRGAWDTRHWIQIPALTHEADGLQIQKHLGMIDGVSHLQIEGRSRKLRITYDQRVIDYHEITQRLESIGFPPSENWWAKRKAAWFQYLDSNAKINASAPPPPCCSNPKGLEKRSQRKPGGRK